MVRTGGPAPPLFAMKNFLAEGARWDLAVAQNDHVATFPPHLLELDPFFLPQTPAQRLEP